MIQKCGENDKKVFDSYAIINSSYSIAQKYAVSQVLRLMLIDKDISC